MANMENEERRRVFLSWSGDVAKKVALILKDWFEREVFEDLDAWVSDVDIAAGARALPTVDENLKAAVGGLLILTSENQTAPWVNFEAGALSQQYGPRSGRVIPLLVDSTDMSTLRAPLNQFQGQSLSAEGMEKILKSLYEMQGKSDTHVPARMKTWPDVEVRIQDVVKEHGGAARTVPVSTNDLQVQINRTERMMADLTALVNPNLKRLSTIERSEAELAGTPTWASPSDTQRGFPGPLTVQSVVADALGADVLEVQEHIVILVDWLPSDEKAVRKTERSLADLYGRAVRLKSSYEGEPQERQRRQRRSQ